MRKMREVPSAAPNAVTLAGLAATGQHLASERTLLEFLFDIKKLRSVVEFGCGDGSWLRAARKCGADEIRGYDDGNMPIEARGLSSSEFFFADLKQRINLEKKFDLAICLDGVRHTDESSAGTMVQTLCGASNWVLFGAKVPYQNGPRSPDEFWLESWAKIFFDEGYSCYDILRRRFWHDPRIAFRYRQSACLYVRPGTHYALKARGHEHSRCPQSLIHPEMFLEIASRSPHCRDIDARVRAFYRSASRGSAAPDPGNTK
jgi:hypothetical protein